MRLISFSVSEGNLWNSAIDSYLIEALAKPLEEEEAYIDSGMKLAQENRAHCTFDEVHAFNRCAWLCQ
jgi:hypothetical protein